MSLEFPLFIALKNDFNQIKERLVDKKELEMGEGKALGFRALSVLSAAYCTFKIFSISKTAIGIFFTLGAIFNLHVWIANQSYKSFKGVACRIGIASVSIYCSYKIASMSKAKIVAFIVLAIAHNYYLWSAGRSYKGLKNNESHDNENLNLDRNSSSHSVNQNVPHGFDQQYSGPSDRQTVLDMLLLSLSDESDEQDFDVQDSGHVGSETIHDLYDDLSGQRGAFEAIQANR